MPQPPAYLREIPPPETNTKRERQFTTSLSTSVSERPRAPNRDQNRDSGRNETERCGANLPLERYRQIGTFADGTHEAAGCARMLEGSDTCPLRGQPIARGRSRFQTTAFDPGSFRDHRAWGTAVRTVRFTKLASQLVSRSLAPVTLVNSLCTAWHHPVWQAPSTLLMSSLHCRGNHGSRLRCSAFFNPLKSGHLR
jgi:hypothetical protein